MPGVRILGCIDSMFSFCLEAKPDVIHLANHVCQIFYVFKPRFVLYENLIRKF